MDVDRMYGSFQGTNMPKTFLSTTFITTTTTTSTTTTTAHCRISEGSYIVGVEALADRCHQVELPVLLVVPERVRHVVRIESQHAKAGEQGAPATPTSITRHACEKRCLYSRHDGQNSRITLSGRGDTTELLHRRDANTWMTSRKCLRLETEAHTKVPAKPGIGKPRPGVHIRFLT